MNFFTVAARMQAAVHKEVAFHRRALKLGDSDDDIAHEQLIRSQAQSAQLRNFEDTCALGITLMQQFQHLLLEAGLKSIKQTYVITIRPRSDVPWDVFFHICQKFLRRKCWRICVASFEQKSTDPPYGHGFHMHAVVAASQAGKAAVLRDITPSFRDVADANCIDVRVLRGTPFHFCEYYLVEYRPEHKKITRTADIAWRQSLGLDLHIRDLDDYWGVEKLRARYNDPTPADQLTLAQ